MLIKTGYLAALAVAAVAALPVAASAQSLTDDVRCLLLSTAYARAAKDDASRRGPAMTGAFYLGRLSDHTSDKALAAAVRAQGTGLSGKEAEPIMRACAAGAAAAEQAMTKSVQGAQSGR